MTLSHDVQGSGPAILLLHSTACDRRMWDPQIPALTAAGHRVVRCDLNGYGQSPVPATSWSDAQDIVDLLGALGIDRFALVGASGGGRVALEVASRWPDRITALALLCTAVDDHEPSAELRAFGDREDELLEAGDIDGAVRLNVEMWAGDAIRDRVAMMQRHVFEVQLAAPGDVGPLRVPADLDAITAPVLIVSGTRDVADFQVIATGLAARLGARHVELDAGHLPSMERPDEVNDLLVSFL
ncbi:alpha/beta fold hydrolase [Actinoplanes sp. NPDC051494]|uniref:alpha/beta fold hydrolase n=1 Tax=Actinoplanes sp. NPDC051494 TaxID=3363907 RepID=UPI0037BD9DC5